MKRLAIAGITLLVLSPLFATDDSTGHPPKGGPGGGYEKQAEELKEKLELTEDQYSKVLEIMKSYEEKMKEADRDTMETLRESEEEEISALLTDDQKTEYESMKKNPPSKPGS